MLDPTYRGAAPLPRREPIFNVPPAILLVLLVLTAIHAVRQFIPGDWDDWVLLHLSFIPGRVTYALDPSRAVQALTALAAQGGAGLRQAQMGRAILLGSGVEPWSVVSYGLLHADWMHLGLNGLWLLAFGAPVARRIGFGAFLSFLGVAAAAGALVHYVTHPDDLQPMIGASAAVSGCMGATLRFMFQPQVSVTAMMGLSDPTRNEAFRRPLIGLRQMARDRRAVTFLLVWFLTNLLFGVGSISAELTEGAVAWQAHIGGFLFGLLAFPWFDPPMPPEVAKEAPTSPDI